MKGLTTLPVFLAMGCAGAQQDAKCHCPSNASVLSTNTKADCPNAQADCLATESAQSNTFRVGVKPFCAKVADKIGINVAIPTHFAFDKDDTTRKRRIEENEPLSENETLLWQFSCDIQTGKCEGLQVNLTQLESGKRITYLSIVNMVKQAQLVSNTPSVAIIQWGPWRTFTVDLVAKEVRYVESAPNTEGRGTGSCDTYVGK